MIVMLISLKSEGQLVLHLKDVVHIARTENLSARRAYVENQTAYWNYQIYRSKLKPQLRLNANLSDFSRGVRAVGQEDGNIKMLIVNHNSSKANLSLLQPLPILGADIFIDSDILRFDNFTDKQKSYSSQPIKLGIKLPIFQFNPLKWDKKIEPLLFEESKKYYDRNLELSAYLAVQMFFKNLSDRHERNLADANMKMNSKLYGITEHKFEKGSISKDELLQVKLMMLNAKKNLQTAQVQMENSALLFLTHLSLTNITEFEPIVPLSIPNFELSTQEAIQNANSFNPETISFKRRLLEANREIARTKGATGIVGDVFASIGYSSNFYELPQWNSGMNKHARMKIGIIIPILDWGRTQAARKKAAMNKELEETSILQEKINFEKEIVSLVNVILMLKKNMTVVVETEAIAKERYKIAYKRYLADDISIMELDLAQKAKDYASRDLLTSKGKFWINYHKLRMLTLYDFINKTILIKKNN